MRIAVTTGHPGGVGVEVTARALAALSPDERQNLFIIGERKSLEYYGILATEAEVLLIEPPEGYTFLPGDKSTTGGELSLRFIEKSVDLAKSGVVQAIVTAPVSKELIVRAGFPNFLDHTHYFAESFGITDFNMAFFSPKMKVTLATIHIPLKDVPKAITRECLSMAIRNSLSFVKKLGISDKPLAVCGLNPHAGEGGLIGREEIDIISPVIEEFRTRGESIIGPLPADTVFGKAEAGEFSMVVALYHDQGLAAFKLLHLHDGVNTTLGLPVVRTSPDHGTAFDIAGKGIADPGSMLSAIRLAFRLASK